MSIQKTKIVFDFDSDSLKELRKVLFQRGLSPQQFLTYVVELVSLRDERMAEIMSEAVQHRKSYPSKGRSNQTDAEMIYKLIEQELVKKQQNGA